MTGNRKQKAWEGTAWGPEVAYSLLEASLTAILNILLVVTKKSKRLYEKFIGTIGKQINMLELEKPLFSFRR